MCGFGDRTCGTCSCGGFCLASMNEDFYEPAPMETVIRRLDADMYPSDRNVMKNFLLRYYRYDYDRRRKQDKEET